ncbi:nuclear pore complex protein Nup160 [Protopterus annectens]|uniref:nuclear pore complex protein Nup160 n=1 Tax=Protopterus annectens TaxID=7888 RepID=UPI001CFB760F|nr:nuclear pore complex protein Nup160 [Protopterus annectens]
MQRTGVKMAAASSFTEISCWDRDTVTKWREFVINTGVPPIPGGLKHPDGAGGFFYEQSSQLLSCTRNRIIHWTTSGDTLQLLEVSLDVHLLYNAIQLKVVNCNILPGGVRIYETQNNVIILFVTNQTVHRLVLPHPFRMYRSDLITESTVQSIFTDIGKWNFRDPTNCYVIQAVPGLAPTSTASEAWLGSDGEAIFALPSATGGIFIIQMPPFDVYGMFTIFELRTSAVMERLLSTWVPRGDQGPSDLPISIAVHCLEYDAFIFALCQDHRLRMWSYKDQICLMTVDMLEFMPVNKDLRNTVAVGHKLRLSFSPSTGLYLGIYLHATKRGQFCIFQLVSVEKNRYSLDRISTLFSSQERLIDFRITSTDIWAVWQDDESQTIIKYINFEHSNAGRWNQVFAQPLPEEEVNVGDDQDPRETYLERLFSPGRFTSTAFLKALKIFHRGDDRILEPSWDALRKEVIRAVESEIQGNVTEYEFSQEEFRQLQVQFWSKFYACCLQYQESLSYPLAILVNPDNNMVCVLKKGFLTFLVPCALVDHLYLSSDEYLLVEDDSVISEDPDTAQDILSLVQCLRLINEAISMEMAFLMESALWQLQSPEKTAEKILNELLANDTENVIEDIQNKLQDVRNLVSALNILLREMCYEMELERNTNPDQPLSVRLNLSHMYGSGLAVSAVCQSVYWIAVTRFQMCRDILVLVQFVLRLGDPAFPGGSEQLFQLQQDTVQQASRLLWSYYLVLWTSQCETSNVPVDTLESNLQHLSVLELSDSSAFIPQKTTSGPQTVVELFFQNVARKQIISQLFSQTGATPEQMTLNFPEVITAVISYLMQHLWPTGSSFLFPESLMGCCQYSQLQEYLRLLQPWCDVNMGSCSFMMGQCNLVMGEGHKALERFCEVASVVGKEDFLDKLIRGEEDEAASTPRMQYYNKVLRLLEDMGLPELVIQLASIAISETANDGKSQAALRTRIFKHHLDLGHNNEAYEALTQNPDPSRQLDCLRQLVVVLCERSQLQDLVDFPYVGLHDEVVGIIESRARAVDLMTHNYYELLYAFHINRHNYRKAGTIMFEYGMRLGTEVRTVRGLQKQVNCYLAAINCLRLIRPEYAWIVKPASGAGFERPGASPKRTHDGEYATVPVNRQVEILELKDLEKEYMLCRTRMTLAQHDPSTAAIAGTASATEMVSLLVQAGRFDSALGLCQIFKLPLKPVFEGLAYKCIGLQFGGEAAETSAWDWLASNPLSSIITTKETSATDEAWRLLSSYLDKYPSQNAQHHCCVIKKLLSHGVPLPNWLVNDYKQVNAAGLLRLYLNFDLLEEATELVVEYVDALLGKGHQYFGIEKPLSAVASVVWLPYTAIDQLLQALGETPPNGRSDQLRQKLLNKLEDYHSQVRQATEDFTYHRRRL